MLDSHRAAVHFDPAAGGWINQSQLMSTGVHSPGTKAESGNGNLRGARPTSPPTASSKSYGIKLGPTEILMMNHQEKNPFSLPTCKQSAPARQAHPPFCIRFPTRTRVRNSEITRYLLSVAAHSDWESEINNRGWYDKPGEAVPVGNKTFGRPL